MNEKLYLNTRTQRCFQGNNLKSLRRNVVVRVIWSNRYSNTAYVTTSDGDKFLVQQGPLRVLQDGSEWKTHKHILQISGSRSWRDKEAIRPLIQAASNHPISISVGDAPGVDALVQSLCHEYGVECLVYYVKSQPRNNLGGHPLYHIAGDYKRRDDAMIEDATFITTFWDGVSQGTARVRERSRGLLHSPEELIKFFRIPETQPEGVPF